MGHVGTAGFGVILPSIGSSAYAVSSILCSVTDTFYAGRYLEFKKANLERLLCCVHSMCDV